MYDLIIIGAGPAGITAAVYAARKHLSCLVISRDIGGQAAWSSDIENYTGYQFITGPELTMKFEEHMRKYKIAVKENEIAEEIEKANDIVFVKTNKGRYHSKAAIIATGKRSKELGVAGEKEFKNKGLTYCATCDGPLFAGKDVAVVGGGNSSLDAVIQLVNIADHVYIINSTPDLTGDLVMQDKVKFNRKVEIFNNAKVTAIIGDRVVAGIKIEKDSKEQLIAVQGVFVEVGLVPSSEFTEHIEKNESGEIKIDSHNQTNISGIFAAGDVTDTLEKQIIIAAGEGAKATLSAFRYIAQHKFELK